MKTPALSTVFVDGLGIGLMGDPRPLVAKVVAAAGHKLDVRVERKRSLDDPSGMQVHMDDFIDRTANPGKPIYLVCTPPKPAVPPTAAAAGPGLEGALRNPAATPRTPPSAPRSPKPSIGSRDDPNDPGPEWRI